MADLYLDKLPELDRAMRKTAAFAARLSEQAENWPQEVSSELLKQLPFLSDYDLNVNLDRVEPQRGFAFGYADISNKTERPEDEHTEAGLPHVRIPVIIMDKKMKPFSVFMDGEKVLPLNEDRIREILFQPATFDLSVAQPRDPSLVEPLMPPQRNGIGMGGEYKSASVEKKSSLLLAIAPTMSEADVDSFVNKIASDATLRAGFQRNGIAPLLVEVFDNTKRASANDRLSTIADEIEPSVITLQKLPGGDFLVKSANVNAVADGAAMKGQVVPGAEAAQAIGADNAQAMQPGQTATVTADPAELDAETNMMAAKPIDTWGQYKVQDMMGNTLFGNVFTTVLGWGDFAPMPMALFTNGSAYAIQDGIAGELVGKGVSFPIDTPRGDGCFYDFQDNEVVVTAPVTIGSSASGPDGLPRYMATDAFGLQFQIVVVEGLTAPQQISEAELAVPSTWKFMRLNNQTQLVGNPEEMGKAAALQASKNTVTMFFNGSYNLIGGCNLEKLSADHRYDLDPVHAEFMLGLLGVEGSVAKQKVAESRRKGSIKLAGLKPITLLSERYAAAEKTASALFKNIPNLRRDLTKEAASMGEVDEGSIDHILSLNFVNPENLSTFITYIPELEATSEKLAEMLMSSYLGMKELPEGAIEKSMKGIEDVISDLKAIATTEG